MIKNLIKNLALALLIVCVSCKPETNLVHSDFNTQVITNRAKVHLNSEPITITSFNADRSAGGIHDYYSEGRYWWPDSTNLEGPYVRRDGISNPDLFLDHRNSIKTFESIVCDLTVAALRSEEVVYSQAILKHLHAWFVAEETKMNPSLLYAQAIKGIVEGRGIGMIDVIGLINVANCIRLLERRGLVEESDLKEVKKWFSDFVIWASTHSHGIEEKNNNNNHSAWWGAQVTAYGLVSGDVEIVEIAINQYKSQLRIQMEEDGKFPDELGRTKPSHYTNYTLYAWTSYAELLSQTNFDAWDFATEKGSIKKAVDYSCQFFISPSDWPYKTELEVEFNPRHNEFLYLAYLNSDEVKYREEWQKMNPPAGSERSELLIWKFLDE